MNECCQIIGMTQIMPSKNPLVAWRVICQYCGEIIHVQVVEPTEVV